MGELKLTKQKRRIYFDRIYLGKNNSVYLPSKLSTIFDNFTKKQYDSIPELDVNENHLYVSGMKKIKLKDDIDKSVTPAVAHKRFAYAINIASVNPEEDVKYGDLNKVVDKRENIVAPNKGKDDEEEEEEEEDEDNLIGPLVDTQVLIDPSRRILATSRGINRLNKWYIKKFMKNLLGVDVFNLQIILNKKGIEDIRNLNVRTKLSYSVASPDHFKQFRNASKKERSEMAFAEYMKANSFKIVIDSENMPKQLLIEKVSQLLKAKEVKSINVEGVNDGQEEQLDLVRNKLLLDTELEYEDNIKVRNYINMLEEGYLRIYDFIKDTFNADAIIVKDDEK
jgi:hypothetical protein